MGPITYSLCQKPILGTIMWALSLCVFHPPIPSVNISLEEPGLVLKQPFETPVEKKYPLILEVTFPTVQARLNDDILGHGYNQYCESEIKQNEIIEKNSHLYGKIIPIRVVVKKIVDSTIILDKTFQSLCTSGHDMKNEKFRKIGSLSLPEGQFSIEVYNIEGQPELKGFPTSLVLAGGEGK